MAIWRGEYVFLLPLTIIKLGEIRIRTKGTRGHAICLGLYVTLQIETTAASSFVILNDELETIVYFPIIHLCTQ